MAAHRRYAPWEVELITALYPHYPTAWLAQAMGIRETEIYRKANALGIKKTAAYLASPLSKRLHQGANIGGATRFKPAHRTWNKGMKGLNIGGQGTRFKPGHRPHTWRPIGSTTEIDGYPYRKIQDTGCSRRDYVPVHHLVWRMHGRTVPRGHALVFRDGNRRNPDINNLELITRAELMRRNTIHNLPADVKEVVLLTSRLTRKINQLENANGK